MKIERAQLKRVSGASTGAAQARQAWPQRTGLFLELLTTAGRRGWGEASPLPGFSWESLEMAEAELIGWSTRLPRELQDFESIVVAAAEVASPSARFAIETALLDLLGQEQGLPIHQVLTGAGPREPSPIPLAHLLPSGSPVEAVLATAEELFARGARLFKVKVGGPDFGAELRLLAALRARFGDTIGLRLDANQGFSADHLRSRIEDLAAYSPELLEEPLGDVDGRTKAVDLVAPFSLAFDETLQDPVLRTLLPRLLHLGSYRVVVLKPMALGGFATCLDLARTAQAAGCATYVSHLFDGPIALGASAHLALALPGRVLPCGLARHPGLAAWAELGLAGEPDFVGDAEIAVPRAPGLWGER